MHHTYLKQALALARIRQGFCAPNPSVGAVIVKNDRVLAIGYHFAAGMPHAEVEALKKLSSEETRGATLYVTLEPCCHWGKTPPCTDLIIQSGITKVVYGYSDPNPLVGNKSASLLNEHGIECELVAIPEIKDFYQSYQFWQTYQRPFVTAKLALSLNGKIAGEGGKPMQISGVSASKFTHQCRKEADAILTTMRTIQMDNPQMNVRLENETIAKPIYIIDRNLKFNVEAKIATTAKQITIFHSNTINDEKISILMDKNIRCIPISEEKNELKLDEILDHIGQDGIHDLWVEAGGKLFQNLFSNKLLQRAYLYICPKWFPDNAQSAFSNQLDLLSEVELVQWRSLGEDALCEVKWIKK